MEHQYSAYRETTAERCVLCVTAAVDHAIEESGVLLTDLARRRLIAALLARPHLILSGPAGNGKRRLARALSRSIAAGRSDRVCQLQGHPWWADNTGDTGYYAHLQTEFSVWRLAHFTRSVLDGKAPHCRGLDRASPDIASQAGGGEYVVCVERMSPSEVELYFHVVSESLFDNGLTTACSAPIRLIGTFDSSAPPDLDASILRLTAVVHLGDTHGEGAVPPARHQNKHQ
jgi:hypothetical protein